MPDRVSRRVLKTYLSRRPSKDSHLVAFIVFAVLLLVTTFYWHYGWEELVSSRKLVLSGEGTWTLLTAPYIHADFKHFLANSVTLGVLVFLIYGHYGRGALLFLLFPIAWLTQFFTLIWYPPEVGLLGISGVVYATCSFWLTLYMAIDRRRTFGKRLLRSCGFALVVLVPTTFEPQVSYLAHFVGFAFGLIYGLAFFYYHKDRFRQAEEVEVDTLTEDPFFFQ